jgi:hypothetical protein
MAPDHNGVATFRIGKICRASCPLYAGSGAPSQPTNTHRLTFAPIRTFQPRSSPLDYDASTKASLAFNSIPTFPSIDFGCGYLLSFCVYCLLKTPQLPVTPRQYGNRRSVLAWSEVISFLIQTLDLCDLVSHMLLPDVPNFCTPQRSLTKVHQIIAARCTFAEKEQNQRSKGRT